MKKGYLILLPIFILALLQGAFLPLNLVLLMVLILAVIKPPQQSLIIAFFSGLFLDLAQGTAFGLSSFLLLITSYLLLLYRRKFDPFHPLFLTFFVFLAASLYTLVTHHFFNWSEGLILAILAFLTRPIIQYFSTDFDRQEIRLKV